MTLVPFNTDNVKKEYLKEKATAKICTDCDYFCSSECEVIASDINRNVVESVQDLFEITFTCSCNSQKKIEVSKFFLPNDLFEEKYIQKVMKIAETKMHINGTKILDELLKWGRLEITDN